MRKLIDYSCYGSFIVGAYSAIEQHVILYAICATICFASVIVEKVYEKELLTKEVFSVAESFKTIKTSEIMQTERKPKLVKTK